MQAAASLREEGFDGRITLIGDEAELPYHKPPLSKTFIKDSRRQAADPARRSLLCRRCDRSCARRKRRKPRPGRAKRLTPRRGRQRRLRPRHPCHRLAPAVLPVEGGPLAGVLSLRSIADARAIRELAGTVEDVAILGGGFIGLEIAATLVGGRPSRDRYRGAGTAAGARRRARDLRACRRSGSPLWRQGAPRTRVGRLEGEDGHVAAILTSAGERIPARMLIVGIGVVPNAELAAAAGIATANGIRVDARTAQFRARHSRHRRLRQLPPLVYRSRRVAGIGAERHRPRKSSPPAPSPATTTAIRRCRGSGRISAT